jgi:hypothetical protein
MLHALPLRLPRHKFFSEKQLSPPKIVPKTFERVSFLALRGGE